jgi:hypothetical protein
MAVLGLSTAGAQHLCTEWGSTYRLLQDKRLKGSCQNCPVHQEKSVLGPPLTP